jgi:predicted small lipoprotein YifL
MPELAAILIAFIRIELGASMFRLALLIAVSIGLLCACGLKGQLYMPDKATPVTITPAADASSSSSSESSTAAPVSP